METRLLKILSDQIIEVENDTQFVLLAENYLSPDSVTVEFVFSKSNVNAEVILVYSVPESGMLNVTTVANHKVPHTSCVTKVRGILHDGSISNYIGKIVIAKDAQQTSSFLQDNVLVVGHKTKNNSQPILTIEADDVKASHGATTGRINDEELFYLEARGLDKEEAEKLVVTGFLAHLINDINDEAIRELVLKSLEIQDEL